MVEVHNLGDVICNVCILVMEQMSRDLGISYGLLNVLLFIILQPMCILLCMLSFASYVRYHKTGKAIYKRLSFSGIGAVAVVIFVVVAYIAYVAAEMPIW